MKAQQSRRWFGFLGASLVAAVFAGSAIAAAPLKTWAPGETLTDVDLNNNFAGLKDAVAAIEQRGVVMGNVVVSHPAITTPTPQEIQNLQVAVTVGAGECVRVELAPGPNTNPADSGHIFISSTAACPRAFMELVRDGVSVSAVRWGACSASTNPSLELQPSTFVFWDKQPSAGPHTYTIRAADWNPSADSPIFRAHNVRLVATRFPCQ